MTNYTVLGKGGFIAELEEGTAYDKSKAGSIVFKLDAKVEAIVKQEEKPLILHLVYLRTYENAGM